ncbi:MAG TPA: DinB family protein [Gemmatimonadaceae bacterium]
MDPRAVAPAEILRINTKLFRNCLHGMTQEHAQARPSGETNSALWVAAHMVKARYGLLKWLGAERRNPLPETLLAARSIDDVREWPALADVLAAWTDASHALRDRLAAMTAAQLSAPVEVRFPVFEQTTFALLVFMVQHDSYHLGQLSVLRKLAGLPGMSYTEP